MPASDPLEVTPVTFAAVTWDFALVGRSRMLNEAWVRGGARPTFVQVPSLRTAWERLHRGAVDHDLADIVRPWPVWPSRSWRWRGRRAIEAQAAKQARRLQCLLSDVIDWDRAAALVVSPVWTPWLRELPLRRVVYDCIDDLSVQTPSADLADWYRDWEDELLERADGVVVSAGVLGDDLQARRRGIPLRLIQNGVDAAEFRLRAAEQPRPADLPATDRPIVGFVGAIYEWIDTALIADVAREMGDCEFVLIGPHDGRGDIDTLERLDNVALLGPRPYAVVPSYVAAFDACWVPFTEDRIAAAANPVKIYEYLALGKPVATTPVADTGSFENLIHVASGAREMAAALRAALATRAEQVDARQRFADANSWDARAAAYLDFLGKLPVRKF